ncbi:hypothetical protein [Rhodopirellula baltica]|uniref:WavQ protein n=1 Tax=Rhodopirellula baltica SWK14 TaxID=993516 RepID=L7CK75_RHOBT|nr:hypothetical protein [Rhodopirellula baltica]ELP34393.1 hypothetical protein RBSWK_01669 [Rhodopirellula baltica SWK14]
MKFLIAAPEFDENSGGKIALHRLCHLINTCVDEHDAFLVRMGKGITRMAILADALHPRLFAQRIARQYRTHPSWNTPFAETISDLEDCIAIYPEIASGNPIGAPRVIRWFLHHPGFFTGRANYGKGEIYFRHRSWVTPFIVNGSRMSPQILRAFYFPSETYNTDGAIVRDLECCHMIRKGTHKAHIHPPRSILLDGKTHTEIARIFKRSKRFISYDDYTAYSKLAACSGCESIVAPTPNTTPEQWRPSVEDRYGIAYGTSPDQLEWARKTQTIAKDTLHQEEMDSTESVRRCLAEAVEYFNDRDINSNPIATPKKSSI